MAQPSQTFRSALALAVCGLAMSPGVSQAQSGQGEWQYRATIYGWTPRLDATTLFANGAGGPAIGVNASDLLSNLKMGFMGSLHAQRDRWGAFADWFYADVGKTKTMNHVGDIGLPISATADVSLDVKTSILTLAGTYAAVRKPDHAMNVLFGTRMLNLEQTLDYTISGNIGSVPLGTSGRAQTSSTNWDAIVGASGRFRFGDGLRWFAPYYVDIGTGNSSFTWQAIIGLGHSFGWGDIVAAWRYTDYDFKSGSAMQSLTLQGPAVGASFSF